MKLTWIGLFAVALTVAIGSTAFAQPGRGGFGGFDSSLMLLMNQDVVKELELVPEQQEKLRALGEKARDDMRDMFSGLRDLNEEERRERFAEMREKMAEVQESLKEEVDEILLPQQRDRLAQIHFQSQNRRRGTTGALTSDAVVDALDISEEQLEEMQKKADEVREELEEKIAKAREEAKDDILSVLTPAQRKKYDELMGEPFEFQQRGFQGFQGRGGGDRGNRGGGDREGRRERPET